MDDNTLLFLNDIGTSELILIAAVAILLFGAKKIPDFMRGIGRGVKEFKDAMNTNYIEEAEKRFDNAPKEKEKETDNTKQTN